MKYCPACNAQNEDTTSFCISCGAALDQAAPPQGYAPPPQGYAPPPQGYPPQQQAYAPPPQGYPPQQQGYPPIQQGYAPVPPKPPGYGLGIASMILGILALLICYVPWVNIASLVMSIIGLVLAIMAKKKNAEVGAPPGLATAGLVTSIIALIVSAILFVTCTVCLCAAGNAINEAFNTSWSGWDW